MYKTFYATTILVGLTMLTGCGEDGDAMMKRQIDDMNKLAEAIESKAADADIEAIQKRIDEVGEQLKELPTEEQEELFKRHSKELQEAAGKLLKAKASKAGEMMGQMMQGMMEGMQKNMPDGVPKMPGMVPPAGE